jgi:hypothetical protein
MRQRYFELFSEWGHRWLDLKRLSLADNLLASIKGDAWQATDQLYPIPLTEILQNVGLTNDQNEGY